MIASFTALLCELRIHRIEWSLGQTGKIKLSYPEGALTKEIHQALLEQKDSLMAFYIVPAALDIPQSFKERPCAHCGNHDARRLPDGSWMCPCYWKGPAQAAQPKPEGSASRGCGMIQQHEREAFVRACATGYLIDEPAMSFEVGELWHLHCQELGQPCIKILGGSCRRTVVCDLDGVWMHYVAQGVELPVLPTLTPSEKTTAALAHLMRRYAQENYHAPLYTALYGVAAAQSVQVARTLLAIWDEAKVFVDQPGLWQTDISA